MADIKAGVRTREPTHPGKIAARAIADMKMSTRQAALAMFVTPQALGNVLERDASVSPAMALRFGKFFGNGPELWLNLQRDYDLWHARADRKLAAEIEKIETAAPLEN